MPAKSVAIIGAGVTGLAAASYARMNGYEVDVFEQHSVAGGLCTAWRRQGYTFDGCVHWLVGSDPRTELGRIWNELGVLPETEFCEPEVFVAVEGAGGERFSLYTDPERLRAEMKRFSESDSALIDSFCDDLQALAGRDWTALGAPKAPELQTWMDKLGTVASVLPALPKLVKWGRYTVDEFCDKLQSPFLAWALRKACYFGDFPMTLQLMTLAFMADHYAAYPLGGSLQLARSLERRALQLGSRIHYNRKVERVLVENGKAVGVRLAGGVEHRADHVIAAGDLRNLLDNLLAGEYGREEQRKYFERLRVFESLLQVNFGVRRDFSEIPKVISSVTLQLAQPRMIADQRRDSLVYRVVNFDPSMAPPGCTVVTCTLGTSYDHWATLAADRSEYLAAKQAVAEACADILEDRFPGFRDSIEVVDVATPHTLERYTSNWKGSPQGWFPDKRVAGKLLKRTVSGLAGLYLAGQWVQPGGGLPTGAFQGRSIVQLLCSRDGKPFTSHA